MRYLAAVAAIAIAAVTTIGADSSFKTTYRDPQVANVAYSKVAVAYISDDADLRRRVEDGLARRVRNGVAARTIVPDEAMRDRAAVAEKLKTNGVDAMLVVRLAGRDTEVGETEGQLMLVSYPNLWDTWGSSWGLVETPGHATVTRTFTVDITMFDVGTEKAVWSARFKAVDPRSLRTLLDDLVKEGAAAMRKQKLL